MLALLTLATLAAAVPFVKKSSNGPAIAEKFQDPSILKVDDTYYAWSGPNGDPVNVKVATSTDFSSWTVSSNDALPNPGSWVADPPAVWAPDVVRLANGKYVLYYAASVPQDTTKHCLGAAFADSPTGPFEPQDQPLVCDLSVGGAIDGDGFTDADGKQYLVYKVDGNSIGNGGTCGNTVAPIVSTPLVLQEVDANDGVTFIGDAVQILTNDANDGPLVEAPSLARCPQSGQYILFYNSGCYTDTSYTVKYATSSSLTGPYQKQGVLLQTGDTAANLLIPGGLDFEPETSRAVFHGDLNSACVNTDCQGRVRGMYAADVSLGQSVSIGSLH